MSLPRYVAQRALVGLLQILVVMVGVFVATEALPGDAAVTIAGDAPDPAVIELLRHQLGLDRPAWERLASWFGNALQGDLGNSLVGSRPVTAIVATAAAPTLVLAGLTLALLVPLSVALGVLAARREGGLLDRTISSATLGLYSAPEFAVGILLVTVLAVQLGLFPPTMIGTSLLHEPSAVVLPVVVLLLRPVCSLSRLVRAGTIDAQAAPYVQHVRRLGLSRTRVLLAHVLPNAVGPAVQQLARTADWLVGGVIVVEAIFVVPGLGTSLVDAVSGRDTPVVLGLALVFAGTTVVVNLAADLAARVLTPAAEGIR